MQKAPVSQGFFAFSLLALYFLYWGFAYLNYIINKKLNSVNLLQAQARMDTSYYGRTLAELALVFTASANGVVYILFL